LLRIERNPEISVRQAERLPHAGSQGITKDVKRYFDLLEKVCKENHLLSTNINIF